MVKIFRRTKVKEFGISNRIRTGSVISTWIVLMKACKLAKGESQIDLV